jgi:hypothetical protein
MPRWRALTDLYLVTGYVQAGTTFEMPLEWHPPTHAVQPLDPDAIERYWQEGPRLSDVEPWRACYANSARWTGVPVPAPTTYWIKSGSDQYVLHGAESFGSKPM